MYTNAFERELEKVPQEAVDLLLDLGMPQNVMGYPLVLVSIAKLIRTPNWSHEITKSLYPWLAELVQASNNSIERRLRHAINATIKHMPLETQADMFGANIDAKTGTISNGNFLCILANRIARMRTEIPKHSDDYSDAMRTLREKVLNNLAAAASEDYNMMLYNYRNNGGKY